MSERSMILDAERLRTIGKVVGFSLFLVILILPAPDELPTSAQRLAAVTALMVSLWLTQAVPIAATSLIPLVAFPFLGIQTASEVSQSYINKNIFLFLGGLIIALGIEKWGLHRRMALQIVRLLGTGLKRVVLGFMLATAFLSMWISNTASTLLMLPIGLALLTSLGEALTAKNADSTNAAEGLETQRVIEKFAVVLMLGIGYSASIGGLTTLVGTPTNVQFVQIWDDYFPTGPEISAGDWMTAVLPAGAILLVCAWGVLVCRLPSLPAGKRLDRAFFSKQLRALGPASPAERRMLAVFVCTALLWIFRKPIRLGHSFSIPGWGGLVEQILIRMGTDAEMATKSVHDSTVAMGMAVLLFFLPAKRNENGKRIYLMDWKTAEKLPWGILLLIGGGFAIANGFRDTGLSQWLGNWFAVTVVDWPIWLVITAVCLLMTFLTEFTSNVATVSALLPILAGMAIQLEIDPRLIMIPATLSTSCAFMLPIATPPNAIIFSSGKVRMGQMVCYGIALNVLGVVLISYTTFLLLVPQFGILTDVFPEWAKAMP